MVAGPRREHGRGGFTLLEVLIVVALSAVIMMGAFTLFDSVAEVALDVRKQEETSYGIQALKSILFDDLRSLYAESGQDFQFLGKNGSFLEGDGTLMAFCTTTSLGDNTVGVSFSLQRVEYSLKGDSDSRTLYRREKQHCGLAGRWQWVEVPVLNGIVELDLEYFDAQDNDYHSEWRSGSGRYPSEVRVHIVSKDALEYRFSIGLSSMAREWS